MKMKPIVVGLHMPMTDGFINVEIRIDNDGHAIAQYYTEADLEANPEDPWSDGFGGIITRVVEGTDGKVFDEQHRFIAFSEHRINCFLKQFAERSRKSESSAHVELMMDDHTYIEYKGRGFYLPENNSLFTSEDEQVLEYLNETYHT